MSVSENPAITMPPQLSRRAATVRFLRNTHGWLGLWGALLGLLFGVTGIVQDHRAVLKFPMPRPHEDTIQLSLAGAAPEDAHDLADWLKQSLNLGHEAGRTKSEPAHPVAWGDKDLVQPAHWMVNFNTPRESVQADYWVGNNFVTVKRTTNGVWATLTSFHKGVGLGPGWILLADSIAGSMILLSLSGLALWMLTRRRRVLGAVIAVAGISLAVGLSTMHL